MFSEEAAVFSEEAVVFSEEAAVFSEEAAVLFVKLLWRRTVHSVVVCPFGGAALF